MKLSAHEKEQIKVIDEQVKLLQEKNASDDAILHALTDFFPEVKCLIENTEPKELEMYLSSYLGFGYFVSLISLSSLH